MKRYELTKERWEHNKRAAAAGNGGDAGPAWDALDRPQRSTVAGNAGGIWPLAACICPICQMAGRWYIGSHIPRIVRRCGYGKPEPGLYLHQGSRKCQRREKTADKAVGRTRGGLNTKLHAAVDGLGNPVEFMLSTLLNC